MNNLQRLTKMMTEGRITRREFLARTAAIGASVSALPAILPDRAAASSPKRGGSLRVGAHGGSTSDSLDPTTIAATYDITVSHGLLRNGLVEIDYDGNAAPGLAESWEPTPDAKTWVFKLRKGVEFHNGKSLEAEDVLFSLNLHRGESKSPAKGILSQVIELKADGRHTVVAVLNAGNADFPFLMCDYHLGIFPQGTTDFVAGTGPFILEHYEPGVRALAKRNPNYWKPELPYVDDVEMKNITDANARITALKTGDADIISGVDPKVARLLETSPKFQLIDARGNQHCTMPMLTNTPPFDDNNVRLGLKHVVDREEVLDVILRGFGSLGNDHPIGPGQRYHASELPQRTYDPEKARYYLKKAGVENHTFKLHASEAAFAGAIDAAVLFQQQAKRAGITIELVREPSDGYWDNVWMKKPFIMSSWGGRLTEDWMFSTAYESGAAWNDSYWKNERFDTLLKAARSELDEAKRRNMYVEMQQLVRDDGGMIIPVFLSWVHAATAKLKFKGFSGIWPLDVYSGPERWWFEA